MKPIMDADAIEALLDREFPQLNAGERAFKVASVGSRTATLRLDAGDRHLRPGGTVSGPTLFSLADVAAWVAILGQIGPITGAVTTNLSINFLRMPPPGALDGRATILKLGKRLAVAEVSIVPASEPEGSDETRELVAHATATFSIPPRQPAENAG